MAAWIGLMLAVIRVPLGDTVVLLIPEHNLFTLEVQVQVAETLWRDSARFVYRYTFHNLPESQQPIGLLTVGGYTPFGIDPWAIDTQWLEGPYPSGGQVWGVTDTPLSSNWQFEGFEPGDTLRATLISPKLPDVVYWHGIGRDSVAPAPTVNAPEDAVDPDVIDSILMATYENQTPLGPGRYGYTVGPGPFPFPSEDSMVVHLQIRNDTCFAVGWMEEGAHDRIDRMLRQAMKWVQEERRDRLRATLERLLRTLERLHDQGRIRDEAFWVLFYRTRYVLKRIPPPEGRP